MAKLKGGGTMRRYDDVYKREIQGNDCCPFWRPENDGVCAGWPHKDTPDVYPPCPADEDGSGCPIFPKAGRVI